jgi:hypothetical protein
MVFCNQSYGQRALFEAVRDKIETLVFGGDVAIPPEVMSPKPAGLQNLEGTYVLPTGGEFRALQKNHNLVISAHGQDAISALFDPGHSDPGQYAGLNKLSASVFEAVLNGDYKPLGNVLANRQRRMKPVQNLIEMRLNMVKPRTGEIKTVKSLATLTSTFDGEKVALTYVELKGEKGSLYFELYWKDNKNVGVGPTPPPGDMALPLLPVSETEFAGYRIDSAKGATIGFKLDDKGAVTALIFPEYKNIQAAKQK